MQHITISIFKNKIVNALIKIGIIKGDQQNRASGQGREREREREGTRSRLSKLYYVHV